MDFQKEFLEIQKQMFSTLERVRAKLTHSGAKGDNVEASVREFLSTYLPRKYSVGHGEVIDHKKNRSAQSDIIVASDDHPFTFSSNEPSIFFIEGVVGVGEVKSLLTTTHFNSSLTNSKLFKTLKQNYPHGSQIHANSSDIKRYYSSPPWFLIALESQLSLQNIYDKLIAEIDAGTDILQMVDAVFILGQGSIINFGDGQGAFSLSVGTNNNVTGWHIRKHENVLFDLMAWISVVAPKVIMYNPILGQYLLPTKPPGTS